MTNVLGFEAACAIEFADEAGRFHHLANHTNAKMAAACGFGLVHESDVHGGAVAHVDAMAHHVK